jgi:hypothetical protein
MRVAGLPSINDRFVLGPEVALVVIRGKIRRRSVLAARLPTVEDGLVLIVVIGATHHDRCFAHTSV